MELGVYEGICFLSILVLFSGGKRTGFCYRMYVYIGTLSSFLGTGRPVHFGFEIIQLAWSKLYPLLK